MIYIPGYYKEKSSKAREKKAELAAYMVSIAPPSSLAEFEKEAEEMGESIDSISLELNAKVNEEREYVTDGFQ